MKILLVEDELHKRKHIADQICTIGRGEWSVDEASSVTSALNYLDGQLPDLILLDMSLPTYDIKESERGGRPQGYGGIEVLRYMSMEEIPVPTVVITGYDAFPDSRGAVGLNKLKQEIFEEFPQTLRAVLRYDTTIPEWRAELLNILNNF